MNSEALQPGELGTLEFFGHRLQTSMTRATVEDSTAGLGQKPLSSFAQQTQRLSVTRCAGELEGAKNV